MLKKNEGKSSNDIAVVGISLKFPGANDIEAFWDNIVNSHESINYFSDEDLIQKNVPKELYTNPEFVKSNGGIIENKEYFDSSFFGLTPHEALIMDPQIRLMLESSYNAIEDAGYKTQDQNLSIGLFIGASSNLHWELLTQVYAKRNGLDEFFVMNLSKKDFISNWIAYKLNLRGPVVSLQTACSTSIVGIDMASQSLLSNQCDVAVVGAVSLSSLDRIGYLHHEGMVYSSDGHCRAFDKDASGMVSGEGVAAVVLRKVNDAVKDGDHIYAIIKGSAVNNDGDRKIGYYAPSVLGQVDVILKALKNSDVEPESIGYLETHGTGTPIGDPIEFEALNRVFQKDKKKYCALGSVKPNIGHLDVCAGLAGLIKAILVIRHKTIPPLTNFKDINSKIDLYNSPFLIYTEPCNWTEINKVRRAGVSSFGMGGTNSHVILEEKLDEGCNEKYNSKQWNLIHLSAKTEVALNEMIINLKHYIIKNPQVDISDISYTLLKGRNRYPFKASFVCKSNDDALDIINQNNTRKISYNYHPYFNNSIIFVFSGQGTQYVNMGLDIYRTEPYFKKIVDYCCDEIKDELGFDLRDVFYPLTENVNLAESRINKQDIAQPFIFIFEYALAKLFINWGVAPVAMIGYSIGEYAAACIADVIKLKDALKLVVARGKLMECVPEGLMLSVPLSECEIKPYLNTQVSLAVINGLSCVVAGDVKAINDLETTFLSDRIMCTRLKVSRAGHSAMMDCIKVDFLKYFDNIKLSKPSIPFISNINADFIKDDEAQSPNYWFKQLRETVRFSEGIEKLLTIDLPIFIEIGPGQDISALIKRFVEPSKETPLVVNSIRHQKKEISDEYYLFLKLASLLNYNVSLNCDNFFVGENRTKVSLPSYPFKKSKYWIEGDLSAFSSGERSEDQIKIKVNLEQNEMQPLFKPNTNINVSLSNEYVPVRNEMEKEIQKLWCDFFKINNIGIKDNFFELGGDSLKAINIINLIHAKFSVRISIVEFFQNLTIEEISLLISKKSKESFKCLKKAEKKEFYAVSSAQKRVFTAQAYDNKSTVYNMPQFCSLEGNINYDKISEIFNEIIARHECFNTAFVMIDNMPVQIIKTNPKIDIEIFESDEEKYKSIAINFVRPFDLSNPPLIRVGLINLMDNRYILMIDVHHIISDLISSSILIEEFMKLYRNEKLSAQIFQYKDFSEWQLNLNKSTFLLKQEEFWLNEFNDDIPYLNLPIDYERTNVFSYEGKTIRFKIEQDKRVKLSTIANESGSTLFMVLIAAYYIMLSKICNQNDIVIGTPATGRRHNDLSNIFGKFVNMLPIRCKINSDNSISEFLNIIKEKMIAVMDNQDYQYDHLVFKLGQNNDYSRNPLFNVAFAYLNTESEVSQKLSTNESNGLYIRSLEAVEYNMSKFDLGLYANVSKNQIDFILEYSTKLFKKTTIEDLSLYFIEILEQIIECESILLKEISLKTDYEEINVNPYSSEEGEFAF